MLDERLKEVVDLLGKNFNVGMFIEHKDELKTLEAYKEAMDGGINRDHSLTLLKSLTHNLITDFKRFKVKTDEYGATDKVADDLRTSAFTLVDAFTALCETVLDKDECKSVEKAEEVIGHYIALLATSMTLNVDLASYLHQSTTVMDSWQNDLEKLETEEAKAKYIREYLSEIIYQLLPAPVSDTGDFADNGAYMCGVFLDNVTDMLGLVGEEHARIFKDNFTALVEGVEHFRSECAPLLSRIDDMIFDADSYSDEDILTMNDEVLDVATSYASRYGEASAPFSSLIMDDDDTAWDSLSTEIGDGIAKMYYTQVIEPIHKGVRKALSKYNDDGAVNRFDEEDTMALLMSIIICKLTLHDKMNLAVNGDMVVSYDGSATDEDVHATVSNTYHVNEASAELEGMQACRDVPIADILFDRELAEGWVYSVFSLYDAIVESKNFSWE